MSLENFHAQRPAEREFNRAYQAELIRRLKTSVARWPKGYRPSAQDVEACLAELGIHRDDAETILRKLGGIEALQRRSDAEER